MLEYYYCFSAGVLPFHAYLATIHKLYGDWLPLKMIPLKELSINKISSNNRVHQLGQVVTEQYSYETQMHPVSYAWARIRGEPHCPF